MTRSTTTKNTTTKNNVYDSPWKDMLENYLQDFIAFFRPDIYDKIDWSKSWESLEQELREAGRGLTTGERGEAGRRYVDKLFKIHLIDGGERFILIHIEVQMSKDGQLSERLFVYYIRLYSTHRRPIWTLAILGDNDPGWRPKAHHERLWDCGVTFDFPTGKLSDYNWNDLEADENPFAVVVQAHLATRATRDAPPERFRFKVELLRRLYAGGFEPEKILAIFRFLDWVMELPKEMEPKFRKEIERIEEELAMPYVTSIERLGREDGLKEGLKEGLKKGRREGLLEGLKEGRLEGETVFFKGLLTRRFGPELPAWVDRLLESADRDHLACWGERLLDAERLEEVFGEESPELA